MTDSDVLRKARERIEAHGLRLCTHATCTAPLHVENCRNCLGWGFDYLPTLGAIVPINADEACNPLPVDHKHAVCQVCGGSRAGLPKALRNLP